MAEGVSKAVPAGRPVTVWGIRARNAPVITMLAYAPNAETSPVVVERLYWRLGDRGTGERAERLAVAGTVKAPYFNPQGEVVGAILEDGTVVLLPEGVTAGEQDGLRDLMKQGARLAAEGPGAVAELGRALVAERLGGTPDALRPVPTAAGAAPQGTPTSGR
jgi:hypothetical protein